MVTAVCMLARTRKHRVQVNLTIDPDLLDKVRNLMNKIGESSLSRFTEGLYDCILRDDCKGCPAYEELPKEEKSKITGKVGVGKQVIQQD
jgi:hypothetical protein